MTETKDALNILVVGASSAIAAATARLYASGGARFFLVGRDTAKLSAIAEDLAARGAPAVGIHVCDMSNAVAAGRILDHAREALSGLDLVLVAHGDLGDPEELRRDAAAVAQNIAVNYTSIACLLTPIASHMEVARRGTIAVIGSVAGDRGRQSNYVYGSTKAALHTFTSGLRNRLFKSGVHVVTIKPGFVASPMTAKFKQGFLYAQPESVARDIHRAIERKTDVAYVPGFWRWIMLIIKSVPEVLFKRLNL